VIKPGTIYNDIISHEDWLPTFLAAAGVPDIVEKCKTGYNANGKEWKVHLDGYNFMPYFQGKVKKGPREQIIYFGQGGELNAVRWNDWKVNFAIFRGNIATGIREVTNWPTIINLRADPYEEMWHESGMYIRWYADNMWLFVPIQAELRKFFLTIPGYPFQEGAALNVGNVNYNTLKAMKAMKMLEELDQRFPINQ
jgi:arylsulfatase